MLLGLCVLVQVLNLYLNQFSEKYKVEMFGGTFGHNDNGYNLKIINNLA
jgi:hypothetical protein